MKNDVNLFKSLLRSYVIRKHIFQLVKSLHRIIFPKCSFFSWSDLISSHIHYLIKFNYIKEFELEFKQSIYKISYSDSEIDNSLYYEDESVNTTTVIRTFYQPFKVSDLILESLVKKDYDVIYFILGHSVRSYISLKEKIKREDEENSKDNYNNIVNSVDSFLLFFKMTDSTMQSNDICLRKTMYEAFSDGQITLIDLIFGRILPLIPLWDKFKFLEKGFELATIDGRIEMVKHLHYTYAPTDTDVDQENISYNAMDLAVKHDQVDIFMFFHEHRAKDGCSYKAMDTAASKGNLELVKFMHYNRSEGCSENAVDMAAKNNHIEVIKFLIENRTEGCSTFAMDFAAANGHLEVLRYLHDKGKECTTNAMYTSAKNGYLEVVRFLHENRSEGCNIYTLDACALGGYLNIIKYIHENRTEGCSTTAMDNAAAKGYLDIVQFLHENRTEGCSTNAIDRAANKGHLDVVKFLVENRTEDCDNALIMATMSGRLNIVQYLTTTDKLTIRENTYARAMEIASFGDSVIFDYLNNIFLEN